MQARSDIHPAIRRAAQRIRGQSALPAESAYDTALRQWGNILRPNQHIPAGEWLVYFIMTGRGWGKSLVGALETIRRSETCSRIAIVAADFGDGRDLCVEGETGIKTLCPDLEWNRSLGEMTFPSGAKGKLFSAERPDQLRGPNNYFAWCDEFGKWRYQKPTWDMLMFTLRKGTAQTLVTTTPTPSKLLREITARSTTITVRGSSRENLDNLSPAYVENVIKPYEGTRLGRQEIDGEIIDDMPGALWNRTQIDDLRVIKTPDLTRIVVAIDPAATATEDSNETGIIVAGIGTDKHGYVLDDMTIKGSPATWAKQAIAAYHKYAADRIVYETNQGGDMVLHTLKSVLAAGDPVPPMRGVRASRGKATRAEPISGLYEQGNVHHVGLFAALEDQLCSWVPGDDSPDRLDALVWALTDLMVNRAEIRTENW